MLWWSSFACSLFVCLALSAGASQAPFSSDIRHGAPDVLNSKTDAFIQRIMHDWQTPAGLAVAVVRLIDGQWHTETKGYGNATLNGTAVDENTLFAIGSNSKLFDIVATGLLIHNETLQPRIDWDTKIGSLIAEWGLMDPLASAETTIVDLMSHRTGMPRHDHMYGYGDSVLDVISRLRYIRPSAPFRTAYQYSNNAYTTLSYLPSLLIDSHPSFTEYVRENVLAPLGMTATTYYSVVAEASGHLADGFSREGVNETDDLFGMGTPRVFSPYWSPAGDDGNVVSGLGGVISSANDIALWLQALLLEGKNPSTNATVIPAEVIKKVSTGVTVKAPKAAYPELSPIVYGGGQSRGTYRGHEYIEHDGAVPGFQTSITRLPWDNIGVAVLTNDDYYGFDIHELVKYYLIDEALGLEKIDWNTRLMEKVRKAYHDRRVQPRPSSPAPPSVDFAALEGTYRSLAYGTYELCYLGPDARASAGGSDCNDMRKDAHLRLPGWVDADRPTFLMQWDKVWTSHLKLDHFDGNVFNVTILQSTPTNAASQPYWVDQSEATASRSGYAQFVVDDGAVSFGLTGGFWGAGAGVDSPQGEGIRGKAEIWFDRL
ncbi:beta-lactamase/transpeptidase-like protein [Schizophyllum amplum]|uniref:Beta-lactamase/transpeptidase-like protein n=1 Tax=Schizophyllum amplum TaxID=97359 RepID=A0A550CC06_9AGAR|nr:beta-lactamase/transpeptidase-like protein [Auriculariopsis ampla]